MATKEKIDIRDLAVPHMSERTKRVLHLAIRDSIRDQEKLLRKAAAIKK